MKTITYISILILLLLTSCYSVQTSIDYDRSTDFSKYKTYNIYQKGLDDLKLNDLDKSRIVNAFKVYMQQKGLENVENGDLIVNISAFSKDKIDINYNNPNFGMGYGYYGWNMWANYNRPYVNEYKEGILIFDLVDRTQNKLVWQSTGSGIAISKLEKKEEILPKAVEKMLRKYPPKK